MFGAVASVIHYNVFSRILAELTCKIFGIPLVAYVGDFGALAPASIGKLALSTYSRFCALIGVPLKLRKYEVGPVVTFLGIEGTFHKPENGMRLSVRLTPEKASRRVGAIKLFLPKGRVGRKDLGSLIGKLGFSQTCLFGKFARCQLRALYCKLNRLWYVPTLRSREILIFRRWISVLHTVSPRLVALPDAQAGLIVYTDAATSSQIISAFSFAGGPGGRRRILDAFASKMPILRQQQFRDSNMIFGFEIPTLVAFLWTNRNKLAGKRIILFVGNSAALSALIRGDSTRPMADALTAALWHTSRKYNICIWLGRVSTKLNIADLPTRHAKVQLPHKPIKNFSTLFQLLTLCSRWK